MDFEKAYWASNLVTIKIYVLKENLTRSGDENCRVFIQIRITHSLPKIFENSPKICQKVLKLLSQSVFFILTERALIMNDILSLFRKLSDNFTKFFRQVHDGHAIKLLLTNCSFYTDYIFGPWFLYRPAVRVFCRLDFTIG